MLRKPINTDGDGCARCIKAGYYKMGWTNFTREILGAKDGFTATAVMEVCEEERASNVGKRVIFMGKVNSSQDGVIVSPRGCAPCLTSGHGNCPKVVYGEDKDTARD